MIGEHAHGFISSDRIVKHDTLCFIHNLRLPHHLLLIFLLSEAMTSPGSRDNNSDETRPENSLNMTQFRCFHLGNSRACFVVFALCKVFLFNWVSNICTWKYIYTTWHVTFKTLIWHFAFSSVSNSSVIINCLEWEAEESDVFLWKEENMWFQGRLTQSSVFYVSQRANPEVHSDYQSGFVCHVYVFWCLLSQMSNWLMSFRGSFTEC